MGLNDIELSADYVLKLKTSLESLLEEVLNVNLHSRTPHKLKATTSELIQTSIHLRCVYSDHLLTILVSYYVQV